MLALKRRNEEIARHRPATNERTNERRLVYLKVSLSEAIRLRFCRFPKRTEEKPQDGVNPLFSPNFRNEERKR